VSLNNEFPPIVFFSDGFDWKLRGNRYHFPYYWSEKTKVLVVAPHLSFRKTFKGLFRNKDLGLKKIKKNLYFFKPGGFVPWGKSLNLNYKISNLITKLSLRKIIKKLDFQNPILWFFYPEIFKTMEGIKNSGRVYHLVDCYWKYPFYYKSKEEKDKAEQLNKKVVKQADLVFTSSIYLEKFARQNNKNTFLLGNGSRTEFIIKSLKEIKNKPFELKNINSPIVGFIGNMTSFRFDFKLLEYLLKNFKKADFVLIGPTDQIEKLNQLNRKYSNCHWLEEKCFKKLPEFLKFFDVCIIPYKKNEHTKGILPIKLFEYLAAGKSVVTSRLYSIRPFRKIVYTAENKNDFVKGIKKALKDDNKQQAKQRIKIALNYSWKKLAGKSGTIVKKRLLN